MTNETLDSQRFVCEESAEGAPLAPSDLGWEGIAVLLVLLVVPLVSLRMPEIRRFRTNHGKKTGSGPSSLLLRAIEFLGSGMRLWALGVAGLGVLSAVCFRAARDTIISRARDDTAAAAAGETHGFGSAAFKLFGLFSLVPYLTSVAWGLPFARIGSWKSLVSIAHRLAGVGSLILPIMLATLETLTSSRPPDALYLLAIALLSFNCIFGALLIPRRIPSYDIPTARAFAVGVTLGLSFVGMSLMWRYGQHEWYRPVGYAFALFSVYSTCLAVVDAGKHIHAHLTTPYYHDLPKLDFFKPASTAKQAGLRHQAYGLSDVFSTMFVRPVDPRLHPVTITPSSAAVVYTTSLTAFFALTSLIQLHYARCGPVAMHIRHQRFPIITQSSAYLALLAGVANNFGTFAGTLVVQQRVSIFWGAFFNAIGLLIPMLGSLVLALRAAPHNESLIESTFLMACS